jgi:hypothetical protein
VFEERRFGQDAKAGGDEELKKFHVGDLTSGIGQMRYVTVNMIAMNVAGK